MDSFSSKIRVRVCVMAVFWPQILASFVGMVSLRTTVAASVKGEVDPEASFGQDAVSRNESYKHYAFLIELEGDPFCVHIY